MTRVPSHGQSVHLLNLTMNCMCNIYCWMPNPKITSSWQWNWEWILTIQSRTIWFHRLSIVRIRLLFFSKQHATFLAAYAKYPGVSMTLNTGWSSSLNSGGNRLLALQAQLVTAHGKSYSRVAVSGNTEQAHLQLSDLIYWNKYMYLKDSVVNN